MITAKTPVREFMSRDVVVLDPKATIAGAISTLRDYALSSAPVVNRRGECVGVFSLTDVARHQADTASDSAVDVVSDWMTPKVKWIPIDATAADAARIMADEGIHRVLVMDGDGTSIRGVVSALDVVRLVMKGEWNDARTS